MGTEQTPRIKSHTGMDTHRAGRVLGPECLGLLEPNPCLFGADAGWECCVAQMEEGRVPWSPGQHKQNSGFAFGKTQTQILHFLFTGSAALCGSCTVCLSFPSL